MTAATIVTEIILSLFLLLMSTSVEAQCDFDSPAKAKSIKSSLVRAYSTCPGPTFLAPNTATMAGIPGCASPAAVSDFSFGPKGACTVKLQSKLETPCSDGSGLPCSNPRFRVRCKDIREPGGNPIDESAWSFQFVWRITTDDEQNGDMTVIDFPLQFGFSPATNGQIKLSARFSDLCRFGLGCGMDSGIIGATHGLPACTQVEVLATRITDPSGATFAVFGSSTR